MILKKIFIALVLLAIIITSIISCKKEPDEEQKKEWLKGSWEEVKVEVTYYTNDKFDSTKVHFRENGEKVSVYGNDKLINRYQLLIDQKDSLIYDTLNYNFNGLFTVEYNPINTLRDTFNIDVSENSLVKVSETRIFIGNKKSSLFHIYTYKRN